MKHVHSLYIYIIFPYGRLTKLIKSQHSLSGSCDSVQNMLGREVRRINNVEQVPKVLFSDNWTCFKFVFQEIQAGPVTAEQQFWDNHDMGDREVPQVIRNTSSE